jgi:hypothetical protein
VRLFRWIAATFVLCAACGSDPTGPSIQKPRSELREAPLSARLAGQTLSIETYLWRDYMPSSPPDGKPLIAVVRVRAAGGAPLDARLAADTIWVINGDQAWAAPAVRDAARNTQPEFLEVTARNGPKWGPGVAVDVVVRLRDGVGGVAYVRAADQLIGRTE